MDADKEGFLRSGRSLTQTAGRAARNINGRVIFYADTITGSMQKTMDETDRRREKQVAYNLKYGITPQALNKQKHSILRQTKVADGSNLVNYDDQMEANSLAAEPSMKYKSQDALKKAIQQTKKKMEKAAKELDFIEAARLRDQMFELQSNLSSK